MGELGLYIGREGARENLVYREGGVWENLVYREGGGTGELGV